MRRDVLACPTLPLSLPLPLPHLSRDAFHMRPCLQQRLHGSHMPVCGSSTEGRPASLQGKQASKDWSVRATVLL